MEYLTKEEISSILNIINNLNEYVINDAKKDNQVKLEILTNLIRFQLKLEKLYEDNDISNFG